MKKNKLNKRIDKALREFTVEDERKVNLGYNLRKIVEMLKEFDVEQDDFTDFETEDENLWWEFKKDDKRYQLYWFISADSPIILTRYDT